MGLHFDRSHASDCSLHSGPATMPESCDCGADPGMTPERYGSELPPQRPPSEHWIVTGYRYTKHFTPKSAEREADRLRDKFPGQSFRVHRIKTCIRAGNHAEQAAKIERLTAALHDALDANPTATVPDSALEFYAP